MFASWTAVNIILKRFISFWHVCIKLTFYVQVRFCLSEKFGDSLCVEINNPTSYSECSWFDQDIEYLDWGFYWFLPVPPGKTRDLLVKNLFSLSHTFVVFIEQHVSAYMAIFRLTYMFFKLLHCGHCTIYIDIIIIISCATAQIGPWPPLRVSW
jgi:hypothetical protein